MNYLITGGTGFIGSYLTKQLLADGANTVVCFDYAPNPEAIQQKVSQAQMNRVKTVKGDISDDNKALIRICEENGIDKIIHLAGLMAAESEVDPLLSTKINCIGTLNVFETARLLNLKRVVWTSSVNVYGPPEAYNNKPVSDDSPHFPIGIYGMCKEFNEYIGRHYFKKYNLDTIALRFNIVYGIGRLRGSTLFIKELVEKPALGIDSKVPYGDDAINWLYIDDAVQSLVLAATVPTTKRREFLIGGETRPIAEIVEFVKKLFPNVKIELMPGSYNISYNYDLTAAENELGYKSQWPVEKGIRTYINDFRRLNGLPSI